MKLNKVYLERILDHAILPTRATNLSASHDLYVCLKDNYVTFFNDTRDSAQSFYVSDSQAEEGLLLEPNSRLVISTGFKMVCHPSKCIKIYSRSSLASRFGIVVAGGVSIIDADFRGEVFMLLHNVSKEAFKINHGARLAQIMLEEVKPMDFVLIDKNNGEELPSVDSNRTGGLGSTGLY